MKANFKVWLKRALVRAIKTFAQTALAMIPAGVAINEVSWLTVLGTSALAAILSILTSVAGLPEVDMEEELIERDEAEEVQLEPIPETETPTEEQVPEVVEPEVQSTEEQQG
jgi:hypothetical protein